MADVNYSIGINNAQAIAAIQKLQQGMDQLNSKFDQMKQKTEGFGISLRSLAGAFAGIQIGRMVDDMQNMTNQLRVASGSTEQFHKSLATVKTIADSTNQSMAAVGSLYAKVAVNAEKLGYSQEQIAATTAAFSMALKASGASAEGARSSIYQFTQILAKGKVNGDEFTTIMENMGGPVMDLVAQKLGVTTQKLFEMKEKGLLSAKMFTDALIMSFGELSTMADKMQPTVSQSFEKIQNSLVFMLAKFEEATGFFKSVADGITYLANHMKELGTTIAVIAGAWAGWKLGALVPVMIEAASGIWTMVKAMRALGVSAAIAEAFATGGISAIGALVGATAAGYAAMKAFEKMDGAVADNTQSLAELGQTAKDQLNGVVATASLSADKIAEITRKARLEMEDMITSLVQGNLTRENDLRLQTESLGLSERQKAITEQTSKIELERSFAIANLQNRILELKSTGKQEDAVQAAELERHIKSLSFAYESHAKELNNLTEAYQTAYEKKQLYNFQLDQEYKLQTQIQDLQNKQAMMVLPELARRYKEIDIAAQNSAREAIRAEEQRRNAKLSPEEAQAYYDAAIKGSQELKKETQKEYEMSRKWSTGWEKAFNEYVENATNAAKHAEEVFGKMMSGLEDMIFNLVKTGKFQWRDFVQSMVDTLLRSQIQQLLAKIFGGVGGGTNSGGNSLLGGLSSLFGGFFADGGMLGAGKWGIAGENGPEIIKGPAQILNSKQLGGGSTNVIYNISAVDAHSFKQMVAKDPSFLYAVTELGRKSIPRG